MTCIVAIAHEGTVIMGGDSAAVDDHDFSMGTCAEPKVWMSGNVVFGACGSFRVSQLLRWRMSVPHPDPDVDILSYVVGPLVDAMRVVLAEGGALTTWDSDSTEELTASGLLLGIAGRVFEVYSDFGVGELAEPYGSVGCGSMLALGALAATEGLRVRPRRRIELALGAAERHSAGVRGPHTIVELPAA